MIKEQLIGEYRGYTYQVIGYEAGHRCGYVGVNSEHPFYGLSYDEVEKMTDYSLVVHGGLTYSENSAPVKLLPPLWWLGFDCAHYDDKKDPDLLGGKYAELEVIFQETGLDIDSGTLWTQGMVVDECESLIDQFVKYETKVSEV